MAKTVKKAAPKSAGPKSAGPKAAAPKKAAPAPKTAKAAAPKAAPPKKAKAVAKKAAPPKKAQQSGEGMEPMLEKLFHDSLKDIYYAEKLGLRAMPRLKKAATTEELKGAFDQHLAVSKEQVARLEQVFQIMGKKPQAKKCDAMEGLVKEAEGVIEDTEAGSMTRDVALIMAAQKVEHYEIASYGSMATLAKILGLEEVKNLLGQTLDEEKESDEMFTRIAESKVNSGAEQEDEGEESEDDEDDEV